MAKVKVGFIGAGRIADLHARAYRDNASGELFAVADSAPGRAETRAREWGATRAYDDYRKLLDDPDIDAVEILLPHDLHHPVTIAALESGKHVSLQKPMALNLEQADDMIAAAQRSGKLFRVFENFLAYEPYRFATSLIERGEIGDPIFIRVNVVGGGRNGGWEIPRETMEWRADPERGGGPMFLFDHAAHIAASILHFMGPVERVHAMVRIAGPREGAFQDTVAAISFTHADEGRMGTWAVTTSRELAVTTDYYPVDELVEVTGSRGILWINQTSSKLLGGPPVSLYRDGETRHYHDMETDWGDSFRAGGMEFTEAITAGDSVGLTGAEARNVLAFLLSVMKSAREHREVAISEVG